MFLAQKDNSEELFAIKILDKDKIVEENLVTNVKTEIQLLQTMNHPYIVNLVEVTASKDKFVLVLEYLKDGDLFDHIKSENSNKRLTEADSRKIFQQIILGLEHCHNHNIIHRDLKPENILMDKKNNRIKISDFGLSTIVTNKNDLLNTPCGTYNYWSPEVIKQQGYNGESVDIWAATVILYNCVTGSFPFAGKDTKEILHNILKAKVIYPTHLSGGILNLFRNVFKENELERYTIKNIKVDPWFGIGFEDINKNWEINNESVKSLARATIPKVKEVLEIEKELEEYLNNKNRRTAACSSLEQHRS